MDDTVVTAGPIPPIREVRLRFIPDGRDGLIAFASCRVGDIVLNDVAVRRDPTGHLFLTYPRRLSASGKPHYTHFPVNRAMADALEEAIIGKLRLLLSGTSPRDSKEDD